MKVHHDEWAKCARKKRFNTRQAAAREGRRIAERFTDRKIVVYGPCEFCTGYHVGHDRMKEYRTQ